MLHRRADHGRRILRGAGRFRRTHPLRATSAAAFRVGGDGSLRGADRLRAEWPEFVKEFLEEGVISKEEAERVQFLSIVGMVGSIDNDMCGTEITIGANSSLHRIVEAVDSIASTASSHSRAFVIEVMGRNCGWLALNAWIACGADWLLIPEDPPRDGWEGELCETLKRVRKKK